MRRARPYLLMALFGLLICCTRTSEVKTSEKTAFQSELKGREREQITETVKTAGGRTTVYKFALPEESGQFVGHAGPTVLAEEGASTPKPARDAMRSRVRPTADPRNSTPTIDNLPPHGPLVEMDVTETGPSESTKTDNTQKAVAASLTEKQEKASDTKKRTSYWPPLWLILVGLLVLGLGGWALKRGIKIASL